jgi:hypothetical protein
MVKVKFQIDECDASRIIPWLMEYTTPSKEIKMRGPGIFGDQIRVVCWFDSEGAARAAMHRIAGACVWKMKLIYMKEAKEKCKSNDFWN